MNYTIEYNNPVMKNLKIIFILLVTLPFLLVTNSCKKDDKEPDNSKSYILKKHLIETELPCFVNIMFEVTDGDGKGVATLVTSDFEVMEDGKAVSPTESAMTVKNKDGIIYNMKTVLLLDNSASVGNNINDIKNAAINLVSKMVNQQEMALYVFSEEPVLLQDFTSDVGELTTAINSISLGYATTNLYGSIIEGASRWEDFYSTLAIEQGFMIVITDGSDTQGSSTLAQAMEAVGNKKVYTVGLGSEQDVSALQQLGTAGYYSLDNFSQLSDQFNEIQNEIISYANSFYYLYYMSPKRGNNNHSLQLSVKDNRNTSQNAFIIDEFNSDGFYSVQQGVVINDGIESLDMHESSSASLKAITYLPVNNPSYSWQTSDASIIKITPEISDNSNATIEAVGTIGQSATISVMDLSNSLSTSIIVTITASPFGEFIDDRDSEIYTTIQIGDQTWMAENLNYNSLDGSWSYDDNPTNSGIYGKLYTWAAAQSACPDGWHLPSNNEFAALVSYLGGPEVAGGKMKESGTTHWKLPNSHASNESNFTALPGGIRYTDGSFFNLEENAYFWSSTQDGASDAIYRKLDYDRKSIAYGINSREIGFSVRCIKD